MTRGSEVSRLEAWGREMETSREARVERREEDRVWGQRKEEREKKEEAGRKR